ncbi:MULTISPECIES: acyl carrier protein [Streptomyces]|uniref:Phosphopantetheine-binding protein n=1 Tax=Streptomyces eurythermus TaxID=42237 RepID=A0ABW6ZAX4_9ACTN|nr:MULTISPECIES: acyl carrier protein [Streptomyces]QIS68691.1 acyl carrier protein [Streptomyces sp. DSM 40868]
MPATDIDDAAVATAVKKMLIAESRLTMSPDELSDDEPLNGDVLRVSSLGFLGMLIRLEDALDVTLPDDLFTGKQFRVVSDIVDLVLRDCR